jgi:hypothetical protein
VEDATAVALRHCLEHAAEQAGGGSLAGGVVVATGCAGCTRGRVAAQQLAASAQLGHYEDAAVVFVDGFKGCHAEGTFKSQQHVDLVPDGRHLGRKSERKFLGQIGKGQSGAAIMFSRIYV